jgi:hypothetical protein
MERLRPGGGGHDRTESNASKMSNLRNEFKLDDIHEDHASRRHSARYYNDPFAANSNTLSPHHAHARSPSRPRSVNGGGGGGGNGSLVSATGRSAHAYPPASSRSPGPSPARLPSPVYPNASQPTPVVAAFAGPRSPHNGYGPASPGQARSHPNEGSGGRKTPRYDVVPQTIRSVHAQPSSLPYDPPRY